MEEDYFKDAVERLRNHHLCTYPDKVPQHMYSSDFKKKLHRIIARKRRSAFRIIIGQLSRRTAYFTLLMLIGFSTCILSISTWSDPFLTMTEEKYSANTNSIRRKTKENTFTSPLVLYEITWVPDGFRRVAHRIDKSGLLNYIYYQDKNDRTLEFNQGDTKQIESIVDTAGAEVEEIAFGISTARIIHKQGIVTMIWNNGSQCLMISSTFSREDTLRIAQSVCPKYAPFTTSQIIPIESLPARYTLEDARRNNDIIFTNQGTENLENLKRFVNDSGVSNDISAAIRLVQYNSNGEATIHDLQKIHGYVYYTVDNSRLTNSEQPWELGEEFERISILETVGFSSLLLHTYRTSKPVEILKYSSLLK